MFLTQSNACMSAMGSNSKHNKRSFAVEKKHLQLSCGRVCGGALRNIRPILTVLCSHSFTNSFKFVAACKFGKPIAYIFMSLHVHHIIV